MVGAATDARVPAAATLTPTPQLLLLVLSARAGGVVGEEYVASVLLIAIARRRHARTRARESNPSLDVD